MQKCGAKVSMHYNDMAFVHMTGGYFCHNVFIITENLSYFLLGKPILKPVQCKNKEHIHCFNTSF